MVGPAPSEISSSGQDGENLSSRQINIMRRHQRAQKRKAQEMADLSAKSDSLNSSATNQEGVKKLKSHDDLYTPPPDNDEASDSWVLSGFCHLLFRDLAHTSWEIRHGSATGLRDILTHLGGPPGDVGFLEDAAAKFLSVVACDKFGDFVSDQVVAPVRETTAMALGAACKRLPEDRVAVIARYITQVYMQVCML